MARDPDHGGSHVNVSVLVRAWQVAIVHGDDLLHMLW